VGNGANAIRGFHYQFLYMLLSMLEGAGDAAGSGEAGVRALEYRVECWQDVEIRLGQRIVLIQAKDDASIASPAVFGEKVLQPFAEQFSRLRDCDVELRLVTSADLTKDFWKGFRALCDRLRKARLAHPGPGPAPDLSDVETIGSSICVRRARVWGGSTVQDRKPRGFEKAPAASFPEWLAECAFMADCGLETAESARQLLSRVIMQEAGNYSELRYRCLQLLVTRVPTEAERLLDAALAGLEELAVERAGTWISAECLLAGLGIPAVGLTWEALKERAPGAVCTGYPLVPQGEPAYRRRGLYDSLFAAFLAEDDCQAPVFVVSARGREGKSRLLRRFAEIAAKLAPVFALDASEGLDGIARCLTQFYMGPTGAEWRPSDALQRLQATRPAEGCGPTFVVIVDHFGDGDPLAHRDLANLLMTSARNHGGRLVLAGRTEAFEAASDAMFLRGLWQPARGRVACVGGGAVEADHRHGLAALGRIRRSADRGRSNRDPADRASVRTRRKRSAGVSRGAPRLGSTNADGGGPARPSGCARVVGLGIHGRVSVPPGRSGGRSVRSPGGRLPVAVPEPVLRGRVP